MDLSVLIAVMLLALAVKVSSNDASSSSLEPVARFPLRFTANIAITAHLVEPDAEYPPRTRRMTVYYDYENKKARADLEAGYEAAKIYIRRYDEKNEVMVRLPPINDCKRSYLGEIMPFPDIPNADFVSTEVVNSISCNYFVHKDFDTVIHIYLARRDNAPVKLIQESIDGDVSTALLTYDYSEVNLEAIDASTFDVPAPFTNKVDCVRHVGGFPYLHIFHYFVKF